MYEITLLHNTRTILLPFVELTGPAGSAQTKLILDTGAGYSMIAWNLAGVLGYNPDSSKGIPIITGNGMIMAPIVVLQKVSLGDISVSNIIAVCHDVPEMSENEGLLGLNFLKHVKTVLDFRALRLTIE